MALLIGTFDISPIRWIAAGTTYWLSIFNATNNLHLWTSASSDFLNGNHAQRENDGLSESSVSGSELALFLTDDMQDVPEPGTITIAGIGLVGLAAIRRRRAA